METTKHNYNFGYLMLLSVIAALGGFLFGYDEAVISGTISDVSAQFGLTALAEGWFVGSALLGAIIGVAFAGAIGDRFGRTVLHINDRMRPVRLVPFIGGIPHHRRNGHRRGIHNLSALHI